MVKKFYSLSILTLIIGILFVGCSGSTNPYIKDAKSQIQSNNNQEALQAAEQSIQNYPQDPLGYYYQGVALGNLAEAQDDPAASKDYYSRMNDSFQKAQDLASQTENPPGELGNINAVKVALWRHEHNAGIQLATNDSLKQSVSNPLVKATEHLQNATVIMPDSAVSWNVLAEVQIMNNNNVEGAIAAKKHAIQLEHPPKVGDYNRLADFYNFNKQYQDAVNLLEEAQQTYPDSVSIAEKLTDAYIGAGDFDKGVSTLKGLISRNPDNMRYHLALGSQLYKIAESLSDSVSSNSDKIFDLQQQGSTSAIQQQIASLQQDNQAMQSQIDSYTSQAIDQLNTVLDSQPNDASANNNLGIIYQNKASALFDQRNKTDDNQKAAQLDSLAKDNLRTAMGYYEKAASIDPNNKQYWQDLYRIYVALGMDEKAQEAEQKAGMN